MGVALVSHRTTGGLLRDRTFGPFLVGKLISNCGTWFQNVAAGVVVFNLTGSAMLVGAVSAAQWIPSLVLSLWAGAITDRVDRRRLTLFGQLLCAAAAAGLAVWTGVVGVQGLPGPWPILGTAVLIGIGSAFSIPAMQALLPALVSPDDLDLAIALNSATFNIARAVGPALGATTLVALGAAATFGINAASYLMLVGALLIVRPRPTRLKAGVDRSIHAGMRYVRQDPTSALLLIGVTSLGFGTDPVNTLTPSLAHELGGGDRLVGLLVSAFGVGAVVATLVIGRLRRRWGQRALALAGLVGLSFSMLALSASPSAKTALAAITLAGIGFLLAMTALTTHLQQRVPEELRGRVMALWSIAFLGSRPIAALIDGTLADLLSPRWAIIVTALTPLAAALLLWRRRGD
jgi:MFS family permease